MASTHQGFGYEAIQRKEHQLTVKDGTGPLAFVGTV